MSTSRRIAASAAAVLAVLLTGCQADVATIAVVDGDGQVTATYQVTASGELAEALRADPATDQGIMDTVSAQAGGGATRSDDGQSITWTAPARMPLAGELTGISGISASGPAEQLTTMVEFTAPTKLDDALRAAAAGNADSDARLLAYRRATSVTLDIGLPGPVTEVTGLVPGTVDGSRVRLSSSVDQLVPGPVRIRSTTGSTDWLSVAGAGIILAGLGYGAVSYLLRRRSR